MPVYPSVCFHAWTVGDCIFLLHSEAMSVVTCCGGFCGRTALIVLGGCNRNHYQRGQSRQCDHCRAHRFFPRNSVPRCPSVLTRELPRETIEKDKKATEMETASTKKARRRHNGAFFDRRRTQQTAAGTPN